MTRLEALTPPSIPGLTFELGPGARMAIAGSIASQEPDKNLGMFFRAAHAAALADAVPEFCVDVRRLSFVNSSAIRLFIDWATWLSTHKGPGYKLRIVQSQQVTWQRLSFSALVQLAKDNLVLENGS